MLDYTLLANGTKFGITVGAVGKYYFIFVLGNWYKLSITMWRSHASLEIVNTKVLFIDLNKYLKRSGIDTLYNRTSISSAKCSGPLKQQPNN